MKPVIKNHKNILVVRDDLYPGGTKARYLKELFSEHEEIVYASPAQGGAQFALSHAAKETGKKCTLFVAKRKVPHPRAQQAKSLGATVYQVKPGYLSVIQARAKTYCEDTGAYLLPFGAHLDQAIDNICKAALSLNLKPEEVWCAAGSGVLSRGLAKAFPDSKRHVVQVGRELKKHEVAGAKIHIYPKPFDYALKEKQDFPSDYHYDAKAWEYCKKYKGPGVVLFWNVTGPAL